MYSELLHVCMGKRKRYDSLLGKEEKFIEAKHRRLDVNSRRLLRENM